MREILRTSSLSQAESLSIALEAEGIPAVVSNQNLAGVPPAAVTVSVTEDSDYDRALSILRTLDHTPSPAVARRVSQRALIGVLTVLTAILVLLCLQLW